MKKLAILVALLPIYLFSHSLIMNLSDNEDGTITVGGIFNTGQSAQGAMVKIIANGSQKVLFKKRLNDEGEFTIKIPEVAYKVILDGGPGHTIVRDGIPPKSGFKEEKLQKSQRPNRNSMQISSSSITTYGIIVAILILFATIFVSIKNTNRLIKELKKTN